MSVANAIDGVLEATASNPILVDLGASGGPPDIWKPIARHATYIGFDPDLREIRRGSSAGFASDLIINKAVCADPSAETVTFYLTRSPYCSSMLQPNADALASYDFWSLFEVDRTVTVPATTLDRVLDSEGLAQIDWLKIDVQGADLRIYESISQVRRSRILALDTEPGLLDAYHGEDLFIDIHRRLRADGFWLSALNVMGARRISRSASMELGVQSHRVLPQGLRISPGWCEARYLRTAEYHLCAGHGVRELTLAWVFAMVDGQYGHALELARALKTITPLDGDRLWSIAVNALSVRASPGSDRSLLQRVVRKLGRLASRLAGSR